jgi:glycerophosphoryl diester phosphodiesterase
MQAWPYPRWIAHRGAGKLAPENTLAAFRLGASHGYRMFECDAKLSADGVVFLMHDTALERTTNAAEVFGRAASSVGGDHSWSALSQLDAGSWHSRVYAGEPLPMLHNIARFCLRNGFFLNIEIKPTPGLEQRTGEVVAQEAARLWTGWLEAALSLGCVAVVCNQVLWDRSSLTQARSAGFRCLSYTVNDEWAAQRLIDLKTDGIITDRVDFFPPI